MTIADNANRHIYDVADRRATELLTNAKHACDPILRNAVSTLPEPLRSMAGYHFGWWDQSGAPTTGGSGKALRPALTIAAAASLGVAPPTATVYAAAVELVHNFTLIHDDIMDDDEMRRGRPTVWRVWGRTDAILLGNTFHALALRIISDQTPAAHVTQAVTALETAVIEMCRGQHRDCLFDNRQHVGIDAYMSMAMDKTGAIMGCACALGAVASGADRPTVSMMDQFGRQLGLAFQFVDDLLGIWGDPRTTGKPTGDLARRKLTLPVIAALSSGDAASAELAELYLSGTSPTPAAIVRIAELVDSAGGRAWAEQCSDHCIRDAIAALPGHAAASDLVALARMLADRDR
ncbi:polyprenyl synthetase family protein [Nocardia suismassiliense]|uniref:polyprenyl synthetase family protein n=1 Tax=Nocardia suismassiliense TaxID=2077092 RepID=UPI000D1EFFC9|nr:polyprenyl synthetase family protein [Nocardia suismassiliense]